MQNTTGLSSQTKRRIQRALGVLFVAATGLSAGQQAASAAPLTPFKIAVSAPVESVLPVYFAKDAGFFEKQGLDVSIISTEGGTKGVQVLMSGEIQAMHVGLSPVVAADSQGANVRAIASTTNTLPITIFSTKKTTPALPPGTTIGISTLGSETDVALTIALHALGLKRSNMHITQIGGTTLRFASMKAGRIEAAPLLEPATTAAKEKGYTAVYDLSAANTPWIFDAVDMTTDYLKKNPQTVQSFLKAYLEGAYWAMANEADAKKVIATRFKTSDPAVIDATYNEFKRLMPLDGKPSAEGAANVIKQLRSTGVTVTSDKVDDYIDFGPLSTLASTGFITGLQSKYHIK